MALIKEIWVKEIQEALYENADFLTNSIDHSEYVAYGTVHLPQSGAANNIQVNPTVLPLSVAPRTDTDRTYALNHYFIEPTLVTNIDALQVSYDKKSSVLSQEIASLTETVGNYAAVSWCPSGAANIVLTTGAAVATNLPPSGTGTRNQVALIDIANLAKKLDKDKVARKGRVLLMEVGMFWELFTISDVVRASYNGFQVNALATGVVAQLFGFDIMIRPTVATFLKLGTAPKAVGATALADDRLACIAFHRSVVSRAMGVINPMYDSGTGGTGNPVYGGSLFSAEVMFGSAILRTDMKGVAALVQTWVS